MKRILVALLIQSTIMVGALCQVVQEKKHMKPPISPAQEVSKKAALLLLKQHNGRLDHHLHENEFLDAYELADGRLVLLGDGHAVIYPSKSVFVEYSKQLEKWAKAKPVSHILEGFDLFANDFPTNVPLGIQKLRDASASHGVEMDGSSGDLAKLDMLFEQGLLAPHDWFAEVVGLVGTILSSGQGGWDMHYDQMFRLWEPNLNIKGRTLHPWLLVYKALSEDLVETGKSSLYERTLVLQTRKP
jgi:hypothetical protein